MDDRFSTPGYESLADVLARAYEQAAVGKGAERHACSRPFTEQPMQVISSLLGSKDGLLYQAMKKVQESQRLSQAAAIRELLGAIVYIAGAVIWMEAERPPGKHLAELLKQEGEGTDVVGRYGPASIGPEARWVCRHPNACGSDFPVSIPRGEACPICGGLQM